MVVGQRTGQQQWTRRGCPRARVDLRPRAAAQDVKHVLERKRAAQPQANALHYYSVAPSDHVDCLVGSVKVKRQRGLPVIEGDRLVGIVTKGDLVTREGVLVQDVMTEAPVAVLDSDPVTVAVELMGKFDVEVLPVVSSKDGRCVGVLTVDDVDVVSKGTAGKKGGDAGRSGDECGHVSGHVSASLGKGLRAGKRMNE